MLKPTKCEVKQFVFRRVVEFHSVTGALPNDAEAMAQYARPDEELLTVQGGSHQHTVDVPDPIEDADTFEAAVAAADAKLAADEVEAQKLVERVPEIKKLISVGKSTEQIAVLLKTTGAIVQRALSLAAAEVVAVVAAPIAEEAAKPE